MMLFRPQHHHHHHHQQQRSLTISAIQEGTVQRKCNLRRRNARLPSSSSSFQQKLNSTTSDSFTAGTNNKKNIIEGSASLLPYGLRRVDYSKGPGPRWPLPPLPPASKNPIRRVFPFAQFGLFLFLCGTVYFNWDESVIDYWRAVERGDVPIDGIDDDEDDDDDDDEDEWVSYDEKEPSPKRS